AAGRAVAAGVAAVVHDHRAVRGGAETLQRDIGLVRGNGHDLAVGGRLDRDGDRPGVARWYRVDRGLDRRVLTGAVRGYCRRSGGGAAAWARARAWTHRRACARAGAGCWARARGRTPAR